jgi:protein-tyrosine-phosphatase
MLVHFVCTGNSYRSRLAEAYLSSKQIPDMFSISSGIRVNNFLSWVALRIIQNNNLPDPSLIACRQTTKELLEKGDFTVFLEEEHFEFCKKIGFTSKKYEIWNIKDLPLGITDIERIKISEQAFNAIRENVDKLILKLQ